MDIPHNFDSSFFSNNNLPDIDNISIDRKIKSLKHLKRKEIELLSLVYKQGILRGFEVEDLQKYIAIKTKLWVETGVLNKIKKIEYSNDLKWLYQVASESDAYIGIYRRHIDEIDHYKMVLWEVFDDPYTPNRTKVKTISELHRLSRTSVLLLRDLPFISNLYKYFNHKDKEIDRIKDGRL